LSGHDGRRKAAPQRVFQRNPSGRQGWSMTSGEDLIRTNEARMTQSSLPIIATLFVKI